MTVYRPATSTLSRMFHNFVQFVLAIYQGAKNPKAIPKKTEKAEVPNFMYDLFDQERINELNIKAAYKKAYEKAEKKAQIETIKTIMQKLNYTAEQAMELIGIPKQDFPKYLAMMENN